MKKRDYHDETVIAVDSYPYQMGVVHAILEMDHLSAPERVARALDFIGQVEALRAKGEDVSNDVQL